MNASKALNVLAIVALMASLFFGFTLPVRAAPTELFFSEYIEGSSYNKALEIFNGTGAAIDLAAGGYAVQMYFNGSTSPGLTLSLSGSVADGDVYVLAHSSADPAILAQADLTNGAGWFNGDDAVALLKGGVVVDVIGQIGFDPGSEWGSGDASTQDNTLRRKGTVEAGDANGSDAFDPAVEWDGYANNTFDGLGFHSLAEPDYTPIYDIQYTTDPSGDSPLVGQSVTTEGLVTARFLYGYFIEDPAGGAWNGLWVYDPAHTPALGDRLRLSGTVAEYYNLTELDALTDYQVVSTGNPLPAPEVLPSGSVAQEQWEGVLVRVENVAVTNPSLGYGEWSVDDGTGDVVVDDKGSYTYTPVLGDLLASITGPLDYGYGAFKIQPRDDGDIVSGGPTITPIHDIQYTTDPSGDSPYKNQTVTTEGLVVAAYYDGYVIEQASGGPWSGLFVYDSAHTPALGDFVRVSGTVQEYYNMTELGYVSGLSVLSSSNPLPAPEVVPTGSAAQEQYESVLLQVQNVTVTDDDLGYGEWAVDDGSGPVRIDDKGSYTYTPSTGNVLVSITGPLFYTFSDFKMEPRNDADIVLASDVIITEVLYDVSGGDDGYEWVELYNRGSNPIDLSTWSVGNGGYDYTYSLVPLCGLIGPGEYFIVGGPLQSADNGNPTYSEAYNFAPDFQNSGSTADGVALFNVPADLVTPATVPVDAVIYGGANTNGLIDQTGTAPAPHVGDAPANSSLQLDLDTGVWFIAPPAPAPYPVQPPCYPGGLPLTIPEIQGDGFVSPYAGYTVRTSGVVVGRFEGNLPGGGGFDGFYLQDETGDGDPATSDGIFVNHGTLNISVNLGDVVTVVGVVQEFNEYDDPTADTETQVLVNNSGNVSVTGTGAVTPAPLAPDGTALYFEAHEGMAVNLPPEAYSAPVVGPTSYGTFFVVRGDEGVSRVMRGSPQDGKVFGARGYQLYGSGTPNLIVGSHINAGIEGPLAYSYGNYLVALQNLAALDYVAIDPPAVPTWPEALSDQVTVATFNTYNFDSTGTARIKVADTIETMSGPLLVGLQEIAVETVMPALLADLADAGYSYDYAYSHPDVGGHGVAMLWRTDRVTEVDWSTDYQACSAVGSESSMAYDHYCDGTDLYPLFSRRPVVISATVTIDSSSIQMIAIANHFKSKLGGAPSDQRRLEQAQFVAGLADRFIAANPQAYVIVVGDLNDFEDSPPLEALYASGNLSNLWYNLLPEARYSYIYNGVSQVLDHILVSSAVLEGLENAAPLHSNADFPYNPYAGDPSVIWRTSDHDPLAATFTFRPPTIPFAAFEIEKSHIQWKGEAGDEGHLLINGAFELPEGYTPQDLTGDLELTLTIGEASASATVLMDERGQTWRFQQPPVDPLEGLQLTKVQIVWRGPGSPQPPILHIQGVFRLPGVNGETRPAEASVYLALPVANEQLAGRVIAEQLIAFQPLPRLWLYAP